MDFPIVALIVGGALLLTFGILVPLAARAGRRSLAKRMEALSAALGGEAPREAEVPGEKGKLLCFAVQREGPQAEVIAQPARRAQLLSVLLRTPPIPRAVFRRETGRDRLGKLLRINREVQSGDPEFDAKVYVESDESDRTLQRLLGTRELRAAVAAVLDAGHLAVRTGPAGVWCVTSPAGTSFPKEVERNVRRALELAAPLRAALPSFDAAELAPSRPARGDRLAGIVVLSYVVAALVFAALPIGLVDYASPALKEHQDRVFGFCFLGWLASVPATWAYVRGHSRSLRNLFVIVLLGAFPTMALAPEAVFVANALLDRGTAEPKVVTVRSKTSKSSSKNHARTHLLVTSWRDPAGTERPEVSRSTYQAHAVGAPILLTVRPGAFGWPWIESFSPAPTVGEKEP